MGPATSNPEQSRFWNEVGGPLWVASEDETERHTAPFGDATLVAAGPAAGERILDVGCGCGSTTVALGTAAGPSGRVLGVDLSEVMLARAAQRASGAGLAHVAFRPDDAQSGDLGTEAFDLVFSRFGVMFFADPSAAFANLRGALRPGGRMVFVCWQPPSANPWMALPNRAAMRLFDLDPPPHDAPGPFSLADPARIETLLAAAGLASVDISPHHHLLQLGAGHTVEEWVHDRLLMGPARELYLASDPAAQHRARQALVAAVAPYQVADGLEMAGAAWVVTARR